MLDQDFSGGNQGLPAETSVAPAAPTLIDGQANAGAPAPELRDSGPTDEGWVVPDTEDGFGGVMVDTESGGAYEVGNDEFPGTGTTFTQQPAPGQQGDGQNAQSYEQQIAKFNSTGRTEDLPEALQASHRNMLSGHNEKMRQWAERERQRDQEHSRQMAELQLAMARVQAPQEQAVTINDLDPRSETFNQDLGTVMQNGIQQATGPLVQEIQRLRGLAQETQTTASEQKAINVQNARMASLETIPGHSKEVLNVMGQIAQNSADWRTMALTDTGLRSLQAEAARIVAQRSSAVSNAQHQSGAMNRSLTPVHPAGNHQAPVGNGVAKVYGDSLMDAVNATAAELGITLRL